MHQVIAVDRFVTLWINHHSSVVLDAILMPVAWFGEGGVGWIAIMVGLLIFGRRRERLVTLVFLGGLLLTEFLLMPILREWWPRPRPYLYLEGVRQLGVPWTKPSFPSAHMHLWMAATVLYGAAYRRWRWPLIVLTVITAYSRPYAGMHHVLDVLAGTALGGLVGAVEYAVARKAGLILAPVAATTPTMEPGDPQPPAAARSGT